jgi:hypothetical protein
MHIFFLSFLLLNQVLKLHSLKTVAFSTTSFHLNLSWKQFCPIFFHRSYISLYKVNPSNFCFPATCRYQFPPLNAHVPPILRTFCRQPPTVLYSGDLWLEQFMISTKEITGRSLYHWHNPSDCTMALGSTQSLTEMSTRSISWGKNGRCQRLTTLPPSCAVVM